LTLLYRELPAEQINRVQPLWERQREFHIRCTAHFAEDVRGRRFGERVAELVGKARPDGLLVDVCYWGGGEQDVAKAGRADDADAARPDADAARAVGYCISTVTGDGVGEIDSLYVLDEFRRHGIGSELVRRALAWLEAREPKKIIVVALAENTAAVEFYKRFGLLPRAVVSELVRGKEAEA
jgi:ribosomal protein S18 acetylase RimI-like enzyme